MNAEALRKSLKAHEGVRDLPYADSEGKLTVGIGHNLDVPMPQALIDLIFEHDIVVCMEELDRAFPIWRSVSTPRQNVLLELMFNLGARNLAKFVKFWAAIGAKDYARASTELLDSKWAKQVGPTRSTTLAKRLAEDLM